MTDILANGSTFVAGNRPMPYYKELDNGHKYAWVVRHDLAMAEVATEDVPQLLEQRCGCCDSIYRCFHVASPAEVDLWKSPE